ncbi:2-hexaprenyl-6-methoxy-1,4-benzoquinone methyltransferase [Spiromyces aspiralis]|uniref:2-hexaprenyl-6-methoxy-1,4-benzoquinone methyltransferase n=1 Tax=Spiromyces aspiralis TaxID=68401 RepID=A0ACC1HLV3_9FUNG|nr:2-hexaprenyl-6-methoxy-1,4-benzoquinone methyltransferase [Spiromyces aspiralis]
MFRAIPGANLSARHCAFRSVVEPTRRLFASSSLSRSFVSSESSQIQEEKAAREETHFGFKNVPTDLKESLVADVFSSVASKYDLMNDAMSAGIHRLWKDTFIRRMSPMPGAKLLDVAGGTGDIALRYLNYQDKINYDSTSSVHLVDINPQMLAAGEKRFAGSRWVQDERIKFSVGNGENLVGIESNSVDIFTIAFGIRNCTTPQNVLNEAYRVLKPGGRFMCLEFSKVEQPVISALYDVFSFKVIPEIGQVIANDRESYQYLVESIRQFPDQRTFAEMIRKAGFTTVREGYENLTFGVAAIHTGFKV